MNRWRFTLKISPIFGANPHKRITYMAGEEIEIRLLYTRDEQDFAVIRKPGKNKTAVEVPVSWIRRFYEEESKETVA